MPNCTAVGILPHLRELRSIAQGQDLAKEAICKELRVSSINGGSEWDDLSSGND